MFRFCPPRQARDSASIHHACARHSGTTSRYTLPSVNHSRTGRIRSPKKRKRDGKLQSNFPSLFLPPCGECCPVPECPTAGRVYRGAEASLSRVRLHPFVRSVEGVPLILDMQSSASRYNSPSVNHSRTGQIRSSIIPPRNKVEYLCCFMQSTPLYF